MSIKEILNEIVENEKFGMHEIDLNSVDFKKDNVKNIEKRIIASGYIWHVFLENKSLKVNYVNVKHVLGMIEKNILNLSNTFKENKSIEELIPMYLLNELSLQEYTDLFVNLVIRDLKRRRIDGYNFIVEDNKIISKQVAYKYTIEIFDEENTPYVKFNSPFDDSFDKNGEVFKYNYLDSYLENNNIKNNEIIVLKTSIPYFYSMETEFETKCFVELTKVISKEWWNEDCPTLYKHYSNIEDDCNMLGICIPVFTNTLVNVGWDYIEVDEEITKEEIDMLAIGKEGNYIINQLRLTYDANNLVEEEKENIIADIEKYEEKVATAIDSISEKVLEETCIELLGNKTYLEEYTKETSLNETSSKKDILSRILYKNEPNALDCGFLYFHPGCTPEGNLMRDKYIKLRSIPNNSRVWDSIKVPSIWNGQSTTIKEMIARKVVDKLKEVDIDLTYRIVLD